jgi:hypothetical protein
MWLRADGKCVASLLFDLSAVFDIVNSELMVEIIRIYGADPKTCSWLSSYMTGRFQMVQVGEEISTKTCIRIGLLKDQVSRPSSL